MRADFFCLDMTLSHDRTNAFSHRYDICNFLLEREFNDIFIKISYSHCKNKNVWIIGFINTILGLIMVKFIKTYIDNCCSSELLDISSLCEQSKLNLLLCTKIWYTSTNILWATNEKAINKASPNLGTLELGTKSNVSAKCRYLLHVS